MDVRTVLLEVIEEQTRGATPSLQSGSTLMAAVERLGCRRSAVEEQQLVLTEWAELFRTGFLAWGFNVDNANAPFFHVTRRGQLALGSIGRDPANPAGYMRHLDQKATINDIACSYLVEGLECYSAGSFKAAAVMVGAAAESVVIELRNKVVVAIAQAGETEPKGINDWRIRTITNALATYFQANKKTMERGLRESYEAYWDAFTQQIRSVRNEAGHPSSISPITPDSVHAQYLIFPDLAVLAADLGGWVSGPRT